MTTPELPMLTMDAHREEARRFTELESAHSEQTLYGVDNGKTVGTYVEAKFQAYLKARYSFALGNAAKGIDFPELNVDLKVTSIQQPQSSCPFRSPRQKIYGLGYSLLIFVYEKTDDNDSKTGRLNFLHTIFVESKRTADFQMTTGLRKILENDGNADDLIGFMAEKNLPVDSIEARQIAEDLLATPPEVGYLTISNANQWRLQYSRVIDKAGSVDGISRVK